MRQEHELKMERLRVEVSGHMIGGGVSHQPAVERLESRVREIEKRCAGR
eukprot:SAG31_NODE_47278_length_251_cov_0.664474_1_plen_48_part_10